MQLNQNAMQFSSIWILNDEKHPLDSEAPLGKRVAIEDCSRLRESSMDLARFLGFINEVQAKRQFLIADFRTVLNLWQCWIRKSLVETIAKTHCAPEPLQPSLAMNLIKTEIISTTSLQTPDEVSLPIHPTFRVETQWEPPLLALNRWTNSSDVLLLVSRFLNSSLGLR